MTSLSAVIVPFVLQFMLLMNLASGTLVVTLDSIELPGEQPYTPRASPDGIYDIPATATFKVRCASDGGIPLISTPTRPLLANKRFDDGARMSVETSQSGSESYALATFSDIVAYDTGDIYCVDQNNQSFTSDVYVFVNDPTPGKLIVPVSRTTFYLSQQGDILPCLPTFSNATMALTSFGKTNVAFPDPTQGFIFSNAGLTSSGFYTCKITAAGLSQSQPFNVQYSASPKEGEHSPSVTSNNGRYHFLVGQSLSLTCMTSWINVADFVWGYPAQCEDNSAACQETQARLNISIHESLFAKDGITKIGTKEMLTLKDLKVTDTGNYNCTYRPHAGAALSPQSVKVVVYPHAFVTGTAAESKVVGVTSGQVVLRVNLESMPSPEVKWSFGGKDLNDGSKYSIKPPGSLPLDELKYYTELTVKDLRLTDTGRYQLEATVDSYVSLVSIDLEVRDPPQIEASYTVMNKTSLFPTSNPEVYITPDSEMELACEITAGIPQPTITWSYQLCSLTMTTCAVSPGAWIDIDNMSPVSGQMNDIYISKSSAKRSVLKLKSQRSAIYKCLVQNEVGTQQTQMMMLPSAVAPDAIGFPASLVKRAGDLVENDMLTITCYTTRHNCPLNSFRIYMNTESFNKDKDGVTYDATDNMYMLSIQKSNISLASSGDSYRCSCDILIADPLILNVGEYSAPVWFKAPNDLSVDQYSTITLLCEPAGRPTPAVTWFKDGVQIEKDENFLLSNDNTNLTIQRASLDYSGSYACIGETHRDVIFNNFTLEVIEAPIVKPLEDWQIALIVIIIIIFIVIVVIITICLVRRYCRKKYIPSNMLLPTKDMINPDIPLDEQTDALPYDIGWEFPVNNLKIGMLLGQGAFGRVLKGEAMNIEEGVASTTVAVKAVRDHNDMEQIKSLISELKILIHIGQHLNIVNLLGACTKEINKGHILVIVEFCRYGNLRSYILKHKDCFNPTFDDLTEAEENSKGVKLTDTRINMPDEDYLDPGNTSDLHNKDHPLTGRDLMCWSYQISRGMEYLASIGYLHRDLAARNVLLADDNIVKICDFGMAKDVYKYQEYKKKTDGPLPIKWMALESLTHKVFNTTTDVWSYGVTIWELFALAATPYPGVEIDDTFIEKLQEGYRMEKPKHAPDDMYRIMLNCWHPDPKRRPTFEELAEQVGSMIQNSDRMKYQRLEDPYLRQRDSRTDIVRKNPGRKRNVSEFDSDYLAVSQLSSNGQLAKDYYNMTPSSSNPSQNNDPKKRWRNEKGKSVEKLPLNVSIDDDDMEMPTAMAPSPSPWERQSHLGRMSHKGDDTHSYKSVDSDGNHPPSYNYVMKKGDAAPTSLAPAPPSGGRNGSGLRVDLTGSRDTLDSQKSYKETIC